MQVVDDQLVFQDQLRKKWLAVPLVKLISASTNSDMYWIKAFNEENAVCTIFVDKDTYNYVNQYTTPSLVFGKDQ